MSQSIPHDIALEITKWTIQNRDLLNRKYPNQYVACSLKGVLAHGDNLDLVLATASQSGEYFLIHWVTKKTSSIQILAIKFHVLARESWEPLYPVMLKHKEHQIDTEMIVDSGADVSLISLDLGTNLGFKLAESEVKLGADGVGGRVEYVLRDIRMTVAEYDFSAPVAWLQTKIDPTPLLLGREVVFDLFNIEFRQADAEILFTWRGT
jgi:hypothetical protein